MLLAGIVAHLGDPAGLVNGGLIQGGILVDAADALKEKTAFRGGKESVFMPAFSLRLPAERLDIGRVKVVFLKISSFGGEKRMKIPVAFFLLLLGLVPEKSRNEEGAGNGKDRDDHHQLDQ